MATALSEELRRRRQAKGESQKAVAEAVGVQRATVSQWEVALNRPSPDRLRLLDDHFGAGGELIKIGAGGAAVELVEASHQPSSDSAPTSSANGVPAQSLKSLLADTRRALLGQLCFDDLGRAVGWRHNLVPSDDRPSVLSTAYGLKVLALLGGPDAPTFDVVDRVLERAVRSDGELVGWQARNQRAPRLETTATAIDALLRAGVHLKVDDVLRMLEHLLDDTARGRPFILSSALEPLLRVAPDAPLTREYVNTLLACRIEFEGRQLWPEKLLQRNQPMLAASVGHTARAVTVLRDVPGDVAEDAVAAAEQWLADTEDLNGVSEPIWRDLDGDTREELTIHHFTATWVVRALAGAAVPDGRRIDNALRFVWERYVPELHFWAWGNGDVPVWMLADAVAALQDAAFALQPTPVPLMPVPPDSG